MMYPLLAGVCCLMAAVPICTALAADSGMPGGSAAVLGLDGKVRVQLAGEETCTLSPVAASPQWQFASSNAVSLKQQGDLRRFTLKIGETPIAGQATLAAGGGKASSSWTFSADRDIELACLAVSADFPVNTLIGGGWDADGTQGQFPAQFGKVHLFNGNVHSLTARLHDGRSVRFAFAEPTPVLIQDNRQWTQTFALRIGRQGTKLAKGEQYVLPMTIATAGALTTRVDGATVITAGADWIPLKTELEIEPGSALDFSGFGFADGPAGKSGRVITTPEGHFAFEKSPTIAKRFYGVNLCFDAQYLPKEEVDRLCDRLVRLGYNSLRIHHYEARLTDWRPGYDWNAQSLDRLDYLLAACGKRGIYVTTDLYVSRPVSAQQVEMPGNESWAYKFKVLVPVHEPAFKDWEVFTRKLLDHVNPHTGLRWGDDPTLAWLSMINEGNFGNYWKEIKAIPQWPVAWNKWLTRRYKDRAAIASAWGAELKANEDPAAGTVALPDGPYGETSRHRDVVIFIGELERDMFLRMKKFLREEIKCQAMLTNLNAWTNHAPNQLARAEFDYVDDHFYVDHPNFIERDWNLPSRCDNANPVKQGAPGGRGGNTIRLLGKPFTVSEYNYSAPGRFRGVGGILTGAMGAIQDWDVIWRFAYSHSNGNLFRPTPIGYFDLVSDPLNQAADRAAVMLYLRGDLKPATHTVAMVLTPSELENPPKKVPAMPDGPSWVTWVARLGSIVVDDPAKTPKDWFDLPLGWSDDTKSDLTAFGSDKNKLVAQLRGRGVIPAGNPTDPAKNVYQSDTGEFLIDAPTGVLRFDTPRTAGGYADPGHTISAPGAGVEVADLSVGATVFVTSVDAQPIRSSQRLLVTHLTDLQNTSATYAEQARQTLLDWGKLPHLVHAGTAKVSLALTSPDQYKVYSLSTGGRRLGEVPAKVEGGKLVFTCDVKGPDGARMLYEVVK